VKIADFGLGRRIGSKMTGEVMTRWYRSPELLMGCRGYSVRSDIWSLGAVFGEMFIRVPLFSGESDIDQLVKIGKVVGGNEWEKMNRLNGYVELKDMKEEGELERILRGAGADAIDLIRKMLRYDPNDRITCSDILRHKYLQEEV
jgi:cyclin-dependent kinase 7